MLSKRSSLNKLLEYTLPKLHTGKQWYVDFFCYDPAEEKMKRKKYMLDHITKLSDRRKLATEIINTATARLRSGWNPWIDASGKRQYTTFEDVIVHYRRMLTKYLANGTIKQTTYQDYHKRLKVLCAYNANLPKSAQYIYQFDCAYISDFLDYLLLDRDVSARTRNNYRIWISSLCTWLVEKQYLERNPVEKIKFLPEADKRRTPISQEHLSKIREYLNMNNPHFLLVCRMLYYTFIRPEELCNIKLQHLYIKEQKVFVESSISKNRRDGMVGLNDELIKLMIDLHVFDSPNDYYLFGKSFAPGAERISTKSLRNTFIRMRKALNLPETYQLYSLKDSGIRDLANAEGIVVARDQARHVDISTTNKYLKADSLQVHEGTKHFTGAL